MPATTTMVATNIDEVALETILPSANSRNNKPPSPIVLTHHTVSKHSLHRKRAHSPGIEPLMKRGRAANVDRFSCHDPRAKFRDQSTRCGCGSGCRTETGWTPKMVRQRFTTNR